jgi:hypothetical protein
VPRNTQFLPANRDGQVPEPILKAIVRFKRVIAIVATAMLATGCATPALWNVTEYQPVSALSLAVSPQSEDILVRYDERCLTSSETWQSNEEAPAHSSSPARKKGQLTKVQARAYWLFASTNTAKHRAPDFVNLTNSDDLIFIPIADLHAVQQITNREDIHWLQHAPRRARHGAVIAERHSINAGTNRLGQELYVTDAVPERGAYWLLSKSPRRYVCMTNAPTQHGYYAASVGTKFTVWRDGIDLGEYELPTYKRRGPPTFWRVALTPFAVAADVPICCVGAGVLLVVVSNGGLVLLAPALLK